MNIKDLMKGLSKGKPPVKARPNETGPTMPPFNEADPSLLKNIFAPKEGDGEADAAPDEDQDYTALVDSPTIDGTTSTKGIKYGEDEEDEEDDEESKKTAKRKKKPQFDPASMSWEAYIAMLEEWEANRGGPKA